MTITLDLPVETEATLISQAAVNGLSVDDYVHAIIAAHMAAIEPARMVHGLPCEGEDSDQTVRVTR